MTTSQVKVIAICDGGKWRFATIRKDGSFNKSIRTWCTEREALRAGRREYRQ